jgi:hypothetical protein
MSLARDGSLVVEAMTRAQSLFPWLVRGAEFDNDSAFMNGGQFCMPNDSGRFEPWPADLGGGLGLDTREKVEITLRFWCDAIKRVDEAEEAGNRDDPAQNWILHPLIDGCTKVVIT